MNISELDDLQTKNIDELDEIIDRILRENMEGGIKRDEGFRETKTIYFDKIRNLKPERSVQHRQQKKSLQIEFIKYLYKFINTEREREEKEREEKERIKEETRKKKEREETKLQQNVNKAMILSIKWDNIDDLLDDSFLEMFFNLFNTTSNFLNSNINCPVSYEQIKIANDKLRTLCGNINSIFFEIFNKNKMDILFKLKSDKKKQQIDSLFLKNLYFFDIRGNSKVFLSNELIDIKKILFDLRDKVSIEFLEKFLNDVNSSNNQNLAIIIAVKIANQIFEDFTKDFHNNYTELCKFYSIPSEIICGCLYLNRNDFELTRECLDLLLKSENFKSNLQTEINKNLSKRSNLNNLLKSQSLSFNSQVRHTERSFSSNDLFHNLQEYDQNEDFRKSYNKSGVFISFSELFSLDISDLYKSFKYMNSKNFNYVDNLILRGFENFANNESDFELNYLHYKILEYIYNYRHRGQFAPISDLSTFGLAELFNENNNKKNLFLNILCCYTEDGEYDEDKKMSLDYFLEYYCCLIIAFIEKKTLISVLNRFEIYTDVLFKAFTRIIIDSNIYLKDNKPEEEYYLLMGYYRKIPFRHNRDEGPSNHNQRSAIDKRAEDRAAAKTAAENAANAAAAAAANEYGRIEDKGQRNAASRFSNQTVRAVITEPPKSRHSSFTSLANHSAEKVFDKLKKRMTLSELYDHITGLFNHMKNIRIKDISSYLDFLLNSQYYTNLKDNETYKRLFDDLIMQMRIISLILEKNNVEFDHLYNYISNLIGLFDVFSKVSNTLFLKSNKQTDISDLFLEIIENLIKQKDLITSGHQGDLSLGNNQEKIEKYLNILELKASDLYDNAHTRIDKQYRKLSTTEHPNKLGGDKILFQLLNEAYKWLKTNIQDVLKYINLEKEQSELEKKFKSFASVSKNKIIKELEELNKKAKQQPSTTLSDHLAPLLDTDMDPYKILQLNGETSIQDKIKYFNEDVTTKKLSQVQQYAYNLLQSTYIENYTHSFGVNLEKFLLYFSKKQKKQNVKNILNNIVTGAVETSEKKQNVKSVKSVKNIMGNIVTGAKTKYAEKVETSDKIKRTRLKEINETQQTNRLTKDIIPLIGTIRDPYQILGLYSINKDIDLEVFTEFFKSKKLNTKIKKLAHKLLKSVYNVSGNYSKDYTNYLDYFTKLNSVPKQTEKETEEETEEETNKKLSLFERLIKKVNININISDVIQVFSDYEFSSLQNLFLPFTKLYDSNFKETKLSSNRNFRFILLVKSDDLVDFNLVIARQQAEKFSEYIKLCENVEKFIKYLFYNEGFEISKHFKEKPANIQKSIILYNFLIQLSNILEIINTSFSNRSSNTPLVEFKQSIVKIISSIKGLKLRYLEKLFNNTSDRKTSEFSHKLQETVGNVKKSVESEIKNNLRINLESVLKDIEKSNSVSKIMRNIVNGAKAKYAQKIGMTMSNEEQKFDKLNKRMDKFKRKLLEKYNISSSEIKNDLRTDLENVLTDIENPNNPKNIHNIMSNIVTGATKKYAQTIGISTMSNKEQKFDKLNKRMDKFKRKLLEKYNVVDSDDNLKCFKNHIISKFKIGGAVVNKCTTEEEIRKLVIRTINDESNLKTMFIDYFVFFIYCYDPDIKLSIDNLECLECFKQRISSKFGLDAAVIDECRTEEEIRKLVIRTIDGRTINDESKLKTMFIDYFVFFILCYDSDIKSSISNTRESKKELNRVVNETVKPLLERSNAEKLFRLQLQMFNKTIKNDTQRLAVLIANATNKGNASKVLRLEEELTNKTKRKVTDLLRSTPKSSVNKVALIANSLKHVNPVLSRQLLLASGNNKSIHKLLLQAPAPAVRAAAPAAPAVRAAAHAVKPLSVSATEFIPVRAIERNAPVKKNFISEKTLKGLKKAEALRKAAAKEAEAAAAAAAAASGNWEKASAISGISIPNRP